MGKCSEPLEQNNRKFSRSSCNCSECSDIMFAVVLPHLWNTNWWIKVLRLPVLVSDADTSFHNGSQQSRKYYSGLDSSIVMVSVRPTFFHFLLLFSFLQNWLWKNIFFKWSFHEIFVIVKLYFLFTMFGFLFKKPVL